MVIPPQFRSIDPPQVGGFFYPECEASLLCIAGAVTIVRSLGWR